MANIGSLALSLRADPKRLVSGLNRAKRAVGDFKNAIPGLDAVFSKTGAIVSGLAAGGMAYFIKSQADAIDVVAKLSDRVGASTESIVGLDHAAKISGSSVETMHKSLEKMTRSIGEARTGTGEAKDALRDLGLDLDALSSMGADEQFLTIADAIKALAREEDKAAAAADIFGRSGVELLNTLDLGSVGLRQMREEAERLGLTFSRLDAAQVEAANDAMTRAHSAIEGIGRTLAIELAPIIAATADSFTEWATSGGTAGSKVTGAIETMLGVVATSVDAFDVLAGTFKVAGGAGVVAIAAVVKVLGMAVNVAERLVEVLTLGFVESDFGNRVAGFAQEMADGAVELMNRGADQIADGFGGAASDRLQKQIASIKAKAKEAAQEIDRLAEERRAKAGVASDMGGDVERSKAAASMKAEADQWERQRAKMADVLAGRERLSAMSKEDREYASEILEIEQLRADGMTIMADRAQALLDAQRKSVAAAEQEAEIRRRNESIERQQADRAREIEREKAGRDRLRESLRRELEILTAATDADRERVRLAHELADVMREVGEDAEAQAIAQEINAQKLADLKRAEADAAKEKAGAEKESTREAEKQHALVSGKSDITKRFANFGGSSLFGFGAGAVGSGLGDIGADFQRAQQYATPFGARKSGGNGPQDMAKDALTPPELEPIAPEVARARELLAALPSQWEHLATEVRALADAAESAQSRGGKATASAVQALANAVRDLDQNVRRLERDLAEAVSGIGR